MCYFTQQIAVEKTVKHRFNAKIDNEENFLQSNEINGFTHPNIPIIMDTSPNIITTDHTWGLIPFWAPSEDFRKETTTLNAVLETIKKKPTYKNSINNRCLILATAYYEWHHKNDKAKSTVKYIIESQDEEIFTFAGIYSSWKNPVSGEVKNTYTMLTTPANEIMSYVHNIKKRMPIMLKRKDELSWLDKSVEISEFAYPNYDANLKATPLNTPEQYELF